MKFQLYKQEFLCLIKICIWNEFIFFKYQINNTLNLLKSNHVKTQNC